jgi:outer membrane receptor protein involved in Fe transport
MNSSSARRYLSLFALCLALVAPASAQLAGRATTVHGVPVEAARVHEVESGAATSTDAHGEFVLPRVAAPALLLIQHPRFDDYAQELTEIPNQPLTISLVAKQSVYEEIVVSARRGGDSLSPSSIASTVIEPLAIGHPTTTLTDAVIRVPGVAENGQGGLFQVVSIRGVARNRVLTLIDGMRIITERRAGVSTSFLDPLLIVSVDVLRGPASTFYASGALGGVMQLFPVADHGSWLATGDKTDGDERYLSGGWSGGWSLAMAARSADNGEAPAGSELATGFDQLSAVLAKSWQAGGLSYDLSLLPTVGRDIQKSSSDFPGGPTVYPQENHLLARFGVTSEKGWRVYAFAHPNDLQTRTTRPGDRVNTVDNEAFDFGLNGAQEFELALWQATASASSTSAGAA